MNERTLSQTIDRLAEKKAKEFLEDILSRLNKILQDTYRPKIASEEFVREDVFAVIKQYVKNAETSSKGIPQPSANLVNACRAKILDDLLNGLPKIQELLKMQEQE